MAANTHPDTETEADAQIEITDVRKGDTVRVTYDSAHSDEPQSFEGLVTSVGRGHGITVDTLEETDEGDPIVRIVTRRDVLNDGIYGTRRISTAISTRPTVVELIDRPEDESEETEIVTDGGVDVEDSTEYTRDEIYQMLFTRPHGPANEDEARIEDLAAINDAVVGYLAEIGDLPEEYPADLDPQTKGRLSAARTHLLKVAGDLVDLAEDRLND